MGDSDWQALGDAQYRIWEARPPLSLGIVCCHRRCDLIRARLVIEAIFWKIHVHWGDVNSSSDDDDDDQASLWGCIECCYRRNFIPFELYQLLGEVVTKMNDAVHDQYCTGKYLDDEMTPT